MENKSAKNRNIFSIFTGKLQVKYLRVILLSMIVPTILVSACLYWIIFSLLADRLGLPESIAYNLMPVLNKVNVILLIGLPITFLIIFYWAAKLSHNIVGPVVRLQSELNKILNVDLSHRVRLRKTDEIYPIAATINEILDKIQGTKKQQ